MKDALQELTKVGPDTAMGKLLRRFWQPVALSTDVAPGKAVPIRALLEDLTLYRGQSGRPYVVAQRCAHRSTLLHTGWVEGESIRCRYHGWKYDGGGQCVEMPAEEDSFPPKVRIGHYPTAEHAGVIFAHMGAEAPSPLPAFAELTRDYGVRWANRMIWPCNWFQQIENAVDPVHVSFVHRESSFGEALSYAVPELAYEETEWGVRQTATRAADNVRISEFMFPNCLHIVVPVHLLNDDPASPHPWADLFNWFVPIDETHMAYYTVRSAPVGGEAAIEFSAWLENLQPYELGDHHDELFRGILPGNDVGSTGSTLVNAQDYITLVGQGEIVDRNVERLGKSDAGIIFLRKIFQRELSLLERGDPGKAWQPRRGFAHLPVPPNVPPAPDRETERR
jgi:5,5'-dehydrodivanillate O-demethylase oxygenase subunit